MTEREPTAAPAWELAPIRDALSADWDSRFDPVLGEGVHYRLPDPSSIELTCFPACGLVCLATPDLQIALAHQKPPILDDRGVVFSRETGAMSTDLTIDRDGSVTLLITPAGLDMPFGAPERPVDAPLAPKRHNTRDTAAQRADDDSAAPETPPATASEPANDDQEKHPRVTLVGRLGAAPRFRTTPNDVLVGRFPLAVHHDDESTT